MIKRIRSWWPRRRLGHDESVLGAGYHSRRLFAKARRRRRSLRMLVVLLVSLASALLALGYASSDTTGLGGYLSALSGRELSPSSPGGEPVGSADVALEPVPEQADTSPEAVAYRAVASEIPGMGPKTVRSVFRSKLDPSWASVHVEGPEDEGTYVLFLQREEDSWTARRSIRADEPEYPEYEKVVLDGVPEDLVDSVYPQSVTTTESSGLLAEPAETGSLPTIEAAEPPTPETVTDEVPEDEREQVEEGLEEARQEIEEYATEHEGTAGVYVQDLTGRWGYGVNPDETFFGASVMKIPLMVAVYRKMDEGEFSLEDSFETESGDWAGGAGWLQWEETGTSHTVEDYLWMMMTQSDNVATNLLLRLVGGPEYVNEVARSLGAPDTVLYQKVTSERAAVPALDNRTTPRDMAAILGKVMQGEAASRLSCQDMVDLMQQNDLQSSIKDGLPKGTSTAKKGGWLYKVYDEAAIVWHDDNPYVVAIFSKHGSEDVEVGKALLKGISEAVWEAQGG